MIMDNTTSQAIEHVRAMQVRFGERADAVTKAQMPPLEGEMRRKWIQQKESDYQDFLMISDCDIDLDDGILTLTLDLRPKICDATVRETGIGKSQESETHVSMENLAKATDVRKTVRKKLKEKRGFDTTMGEIPAFETMIETVEKVNPIVKKKIRKRRVIKRKVGLSGYNPNFEYGGEG